MWISQAPLTWFSRSVFSPPLSTSWPVHVLPLHTFDTWAQSQLENCREESASSLCGLLRCAHWTAVTPVFVPLPVSCSLTCDRAYLVSLHLFPLGWTGVTWEPDSFRCILKWTNMCSPWHQYYLPAPGHVLPWNVTWKGTSKRSWWYPGRAGKSQMRWVEFVEATFLWNVLFNLCKLIFWNPPRSDQKLCSHSFTVTADAS